MLRIFHHLKKFLLANENKFVGLILGILCILQINILWKYRAELRHAFSQNMVYLATQLILNNLVYIIYLMMASFILLLANKPRRKYSKIGPNLISLVAAFFPYILIFSPEPTLLRVPIFIPLSLMFLGAIISVIALISLKKSFSITPEVRGFVVSGLYSFVRHPMYLGGFISAAGFVLLRLSIFSLTVYITWIMIQVWRARFEEQLLVKEYPDYEKYLKKTSAFFPLPKMRR